MEVKQYKNSRLIIFLRFYQINVPGQAISTDEQVSQ